MQDNGMMSGLTKHPETKHRLVMSESSKITANKYYFNRRRSLKEEVEEGEEGSVTHNISLSSISFSLISLSALPNTLSLSLLLFFFPSIESCSLLFDTNFEMGTHHCTTDPTVL